MRILAVRINRNIPPGVHSQSAIPAAAASSALVPRRIAAGQHHYSADLRNPVLCLHVGKHATGAGVSETGLAVAGFLLGKKYTPHPTSRHVPRAVLRYAQRGELHGLLPVLPPPQALQRLICQMRQPEEAASICRGGCCNILQRHAAEVRHLLSHKTRTPGYIQFTTVRLG